MLHHVIFIFQTSLHIASSHGHKKTVAVLLEHPGTDINKLDDNTEVLAFPLNSGT